MAKETKAKVFTPVEMNEEELKEFDDKIKEVSEARTFGEMQLISPTTLSNPEDIERAKRLSLRVAFSIFYRKNSLNNSQNEIKALEKIKRFLTNDSNKSYLESSNMWKGQLQTVDQRIGEFNKAIENATKTDEAEVLFLEQIKEHTYGDGNYDYDYFMSILPYGNVNGDTAEFTGDLRIMMKSYGFLTEEEPKVEEVNAEVVEEEVKEEKGNV